jgi:elongation factor Ts
MMDCKRALVETEGDFERARRLLREKGMASAAKRADRETKEGIVLVREHDATAAIVAVGCETEPVSKNDDFRSFAQAVLDAVDADGDDAVTALDGRRVELSALLGENIQIVGARRLTAGEGEIFATYVHLGRIGVVVQGKGNPEVARQLAMHISFSRPLYRTRDEVPAGLIEAEREILFAQDDVQSQPEEKRSLIVEGRLNKFFFGPTVLNDQAWIHEEKLTVAKALSQGGFELFDYVWLAVN